MLESAAVGNRLGELRLTLWRGTALLAGVLAGFGCSAEGEQSDVAQVRAPIIYGSDDRGQGRDASAERAVLTRASVAFVPETALTFPDAEHVRLHGPTLKDALGVCSDEPFAQESVISTCSGTLVAADLVLTAGHCVSATGCNGARVVFGYALNAESEVPLLSVDQVATCVEVVNRSTTGGLDFALVRVNHVPPGVAPVPVRVGDRALALDQRLVVIGHPTGLPQKIADNAWVSASRADTRDFFAANLDVFPGSSGGGVFDEDSGELVGLVARGPDGGYVRNPGESCFRAQRVADSHPVVIESTYVARALAALCASAAEPVLCACGNGSCEAALRENSASCPSDCGSSCGDGACNGPESSASCYADCGSCGNAVCEPYEIGRLSCCQDCGCPDGFECSSATCLARLGNVNHDDRVDDADVALLSRLPPSRLPTQADVDCNGSVNARDRSALAARVAGSSTLLPCETPSDVAIGVRHTCVLAHGKVRCFGDNSRGQLGTSDRPLGASAAHSVEVRLPSDAISLSAGTLHTCARLANGRIACWGDNQLGQLGENPARRGAAVLVPLSGSAVDVQAGDGHSCALMADGAVRCWGDNRFGQLGLGLRPVGASPFAPAVLPGSVTAIALGASHSCALMRDASVRCWGLNQFGQLGLGNTQNLGDDEAPSVASAIDLGGSAKEIFAHWMQTCALRTDGAAVCWGDNTFSQLGVSTPARIGDDEAPSAVAPIALGGPIRGLELGQAHSCALYEDESLRCWGLGLSGALGYGPTLPAPPPPPPGAPPLPGTPPSRLPSVPLGSRVSAAYAGSQTTCARVVTGELYCFGANFSGQLGYAFRSNVGDDETPSSVGPVPLAEEPELGWTFVEAATLDARLRVASDRNGSEVTLSLRDPYLEEDDLRVIYPFSVAERPHSKVVLSERSSDIRLTPENAPDLFSLELMFEPAEGCARGHSLKQQVRVGFRRSHSGWDPSNDYGASGSSDGTWKSSSRIQILRSDGTVYNGWSRAAQVP
jgi:alpha-tubulin suppressor-like RCC1 family protein/V8-like Glu-specific endopeptidase